MICLVRTRKSRSSAHLLGVRPQTLPNLQLKSLVSASTLGNQPKNLAETRTPARNLYCLPGWWTTEGTPKMQNIKGEPILGKEAAPCEFSTFIMGLPSQTKFLYLRSLVLANRLTASPASRCFLQNHPARARFGRAKMDWAVWQISEKDRT